MIVRKMRKGKEHIIRRVSGTVKLRCPVCGSMWMNETDGEYEFGECEHLRFTWTVSYHAGGIGFVGDWDSDIFEGKLIATYDALLEERGDKPEGDLPGDPDDIVEVLERTKDEEIDEVWMYIYREEFCGGGGGDAAEFYGIKIDPDSLKH